MENISIRMIKFLENLKTKNENTKKLTANLTARTKWSSEFLFEQEVLLYESWSIQKLIFNKLEALS